MKIRLGQIKSIYKFHGKNSGFVDSGFVKTCDELVIGGDWNRAATSSVLTPVNLTRWALFYPKKNETAVQGFCKMMQQMAQKMGITFASPKVNDFLKKSFMCEFKYSKVA